jgi:hypothetical protein
MGFETLVLSLIYLNSRGQCYKTIVVIFHVKENPIISKVKILW